MKILANGGMNLSELDGWWVEAYSPEVGWAIGDGKEHGDDPNVDAAEAEAMYTLLEREIVPKFYQRDQQGVPTRWIAMMRESMARLTPVFSASRTVREYTEKHYLPGAAAYCGRAAERGKAGVELLQWQDTLSEHWSHIRFGQLHVETKDSQHLFRSSGLSGRYERRCGAVELYADSADGISRSGKPCSAGTSCSVGRAVMPTRHRCLPRGRRATTRRASIPFKAGAFVPLEANQILWQR